MTSQADEEVSSNTSTYEMQVNSREGAHVFMLTRVNGSLVCEALSLHQTD